MVNTSVLAGEVVETAPEKHEITCEISYGGMPSFVVKTGVEEELFAKIESNRRNGMQTFAAITGLLVPGIEGLFKFVPNNVSITYRENVRNSAEA